MLRDMVLKLAATPAALALATCLPQATLAETFKLTIAASHPATLSWVGTLQTTFEPEVNRILEEKGSEHRVEWQEAFGGQLYKGNATLTSVGDGITDVGWVWIGMEPSKLPLAQISSVTPFVTDDVEKILTVVNKMHDEIPELRQQWEDNNTVFLGASGNDTYDLYLKSPITSLAELGGLRLTAPAALAVWLHGSGAVLKEGGLPSYYTDIQTGLADGTISMATGIYPTKVYEVAPYVVRVNIGAVYSGALAVNKDVFDGLPADVQQAMREAGKAYSIAEGRDINNRAANALAKMQEIGATQDPPVTVSDLPADQRQKWADMLPNLAGEWVANNGAPAAKFLTGYMEGLRAAGAVPVRDWDKETAAAN